VLVEQNPLSSLKKLLSSIPEDQAGRQEAREQQDLAILSYVMEEQSFGRRNK